MLSVINPKIISAFFVIKPKMIKIKLMKQNQKGIKKTLNLQNKLSLSDIVNP